MKRWEINSSYSASLRSVVLKHLQISSKVYLHKDVTEARITRDKIDIQAIIGILQETFVNPFSDQPLLSISTGIVVEQDAVKNRHEDIH